MKKILLSSLLLLSSLMAADDLHDIKLKSIDGDEVALKEYAGKVLLIVNVASECGYTGQYSGLQALHEKYSPKGFLVLGIPCNDFGGQEPGSEAEIKAFCTSRYSVTFPMFEKVTVLGPEKHPLYKLLTGAGAAFPGEVEWNFGKFLIGKDGKVVARFGSDAEPEGGDLEKAIKQAVDK